MGAKTQAEKAAEFLELHRGPKILVLANVWDVVSARLVERAGFPALATSSAAVANSLGYPDGQRISREEMLAAVKRIASKVSVPVSADLESGYGTSLDAVAETARGLVEAGAVGLNFEDSTGDAKDSLFDVTEQVEKIKRLRAEGEKLAVHIVINPRTDVYLDQVGEPASRFEHAVSRLNAYRQAGADCLFAPGVYDAETIGKLVKAINGPLNILAGPKTPSIPQLEKLGVARVSFGSWPMRATMSVFDRFVRELRERGTFGSLEAGITYPEMNKLVE
jgi:2-methylisocitrate lyase-like PEP mutase family enzyme